MNKKIEIKTIKGIRICRICKGICHENSYRDSWKWAKRHIYFCSKIHLKLYLLKRVNRFLPKRLYFTLDNPFFNIDQKIKDNYEKINIITR